VPTGEHDDTPDDAPDDRRSLVRPGTTGTARSGFVLSKQIQKYVSPSGLVKRRPLWSVARFCGSLNPIFGRLAGPKSL